MIPESTHLACMAAVSRYEHVIEVYFVLVSRSSVIFGPVNFVRDEFSAGVWLASAGVCRVSATVVMIRRVSTTGSYRRSTSTHHGKAVGGDGLTPYAGNRPVRC